MKITFVKPVVTQNGGSRVVAIYAEKLRGLGHDVTVVSRRPESVSLPRHILNYFKGRQNVELDQNRTAYFDRLGKNHVQIPWRFPLRNSDIPDGDVVIATWWRTAYEVAMLPPEKGKKIYFVQGHEVSHGQSDLGAGSYYLPLRKIVISKWLEDIMSGVYDQDDTFKVLNAIDTDQFQAPKREKNVQPTVGFIYSTKSIKGTDIALRVIQKLQKAYPDLRVVSFGATEPTRELSLPKTSHFLRLPSQSDIPELYAQCDAWILPSRTEGFGLPILEAMACRTPIVTTRIGAAEDIVENGKNGYVVDIDDSEAMATRVRSILELTPKQWRAMSDAAYGTAADYNWDDAAGLFDAAIRTIAQME